MSLEQLRDFAQKIRTNAELAAICGSGSAADADDQARIARDAGFDVHPSDLVNYGDGALVENVEEDFFMKPNWWTLIEGQGAEVPVTLDLDGDGIVDAVKVGDKWMLPNDES